MLVLFLFFFFLPTFRYLWFLTSVLHVPHSLSYTFNSSSLPFSPSKTKTLTASEESTQHNAWRCRHSTVSCWLSPDLCLLTAHSLLFLVPHILQIPLLPIPAWLGPNIQPKREEGEKRTLFTHPWLPSIFKASDTLTTRFPLTLASWSHISPIGHPGLAANTH